MNRRELLKGLMAGGVIVAGELWIPGQKLISIPSKQFWGPPVSSFFRLSLEDQTIEYIGPPDQYVPMTELHNWLMKNNPHLMNHIENHRVVDLSRGCRFDKPEHLTNGTLSQDSQRPEIDQGYEEKEIWATWGESDDDELYFDKQYMSPGEFRHQERMKEAAPHRGYKYPA